MKTLLLLRHAKSSWDDPSLSDFDRPLNDRGKRDAPRMAKRLKEKDILIDLMITSPAKRTYATCLKIAEALNFPKDKIKLAEKLYHASEDTMLDIIRKINDHHTTVMLFGHNPGLTDFVNSVTNNNILNVPTCGVAACDFPVTSWKEVGWGKGELTFYDYPKNKEN